MYSHESFWLNLADKSSITFLLNDAPEVVKNFKTLNYEGTQSRVVENTDDKNYYNLQDKLGWYAESVITDLESGSVNEFIKKEGKWFNYIQGTATTLSNLDTNEFSVQGIGTATNVASGDGYSQAVILTINENND